MTYPPPPEDPSQPWQATPPPQQPYGQVPQQPYGQVPQQPWQAYPTSPPPGYPSYPPPGYPGAPPLNPYGVQSGMGITAGMGSRLGARLIDGLIIGVPFGIVLAIMQSNVKPRVCNVDSFGSSTCTGGNLGAVAAVELIFIVVSMAYYCIMTGVTGATIGKRAVGIKVVDERTGQPIGVGRALGRELILGLSGLLCTIGYWSPFFDNTGRRQGWHDKVGSDFVVEAH